MIYKGVLCIFLCWFCLSIIPLFQLYNSQPIPYFIIRRSSLSIKPYHPSFSYIMSYTATWTPLPTHKNAQHEAGGPNIRAITSKYSSGSKASVSFPNDSFLPLHRFLCFMVARASVAQEGSSSVASLPKNCRTLKNSPPFIVGNAKNAMWIARRFPNSKNVDP